MVGWPKGIQQSETLWLQDRRFGEEKSGLKDKGRRQTEAGSGSPVPGDKGSSGAREECDFDTLLSLSPRSTPIMIPQGLRGCPATEACSSGALEGAEDEQVLEPLG